MTNTKAVVKQPELSEEQLDLIKRTIAKEATPDELALFVYQAKRTGLDPLSRQLHFVKRYASLKDENGNWRKEGVVTILTGIDGYRTIAARTGEYARNDDAVFDAVLANEVCERCLSPLYIDNVFFL